jgi:hypothetical protein
MAVILNREIDPYHVPTEAQCCLCSRRVHDPFVLWQTNEEVIYVCSHCCEPPEINGLIADILQVRAINELRRLGHPDAMLQRVFPGELQRRHDEECESARRAMEEMAAIGREESPPQKPKGKSSWQ